jgi:hypothetical protein
MKVELNTLVCPIITPDTYGTEFQYNISDACWDDFKTMLCNIGAKYIKKAVRETKDFAKCPVTVSRNLVSPSQYNYVTDSIDFNVYVEDELIETLKNDRVSEQFLKYIKKFGSHSGFISSYPTTEKEVEDAFEDTKSNKFRLLIAEFIMYEVEYVEDLDNYQRDFLDEVWDEAVENGFEEDEEEYEESAVIKAVNNILEGANIQDTISKASLNEKPQMYMKQRTIEVVLPNEEPFFITLSVPGNMKNPKGFIQSWVKSHLPSAADWDYSEAKKTKGCKISEAKKVNTDKLEKELTKALDDYMRAQGFEPDEIKEYAGVDVEPEADRIVVNVWAEISYDGLMDLADKLDPIIAKYDKYAYFEPETSGRLVGVIEI